MAEGACENEVEGEEHERERGADREHDGEKQTGADAARSHRNA